MPSPVAWPQPPCSAPVSVLAPAVPAHATVSPDAQIVSSNAFLTNGYVEIGGRANGSFGTTVAAPSGYHPHGPGNHIGFVSDRDKDGWGVGTDDGDFFTPGSPYEAWGIQAGDGGTTNWNNNSHTAIAGAWNSPTTSGGGASVRWDSTAPVDGVTVRQVVSAPANDLFMQIDVTLTNTAGTAMTNLYYMRSVDPDNCATRVTAVCDNNGDGVPDSPAIYKTSNTVVAQLTAGDSAAAVSATQTDGSYLGIQTTATGGLAVIANSSFCANVTGLQGFYLSPPSVSGCVAQTAKNAHVFADSGVFLLVKTATLAAHSSRTFRLSYVLAATAAKLPQTIVFLASHQISVANGAVSLPARATSGLPVTYHTRTPHVCTVLGTTAMLRAAGTCTLSVIQAGNTVYSPLNTTLTFRVAPGLAATGAPVLPILALGAALLVVGAACTVLAKRVPLG